MCGISVYFRKNGLDKRRLLDAINSLSTIRHRGPDGEGLVAIDLKSGYVQLIRTNETPQGILDRTDLPVVRPEDYEDGSAQLLIGHRRLSIIDLSISGHQPMQDKAGNRWMVFNGEVYNYLELREELRTFGHEFRSDSDSEVILKAYTQWGIDCFNKFNGMWTIVMYDATSRSLILSNDRYGVKPLFYYQTENELIAVSEQKQFFAFKDCRLSFNTGKIDSYLKYCHLCDNQDTFFNEVKRFPPSHIADMQLIMASLELHPKPYYVLKISEANKNIGEKAAEEQLRSLLNYAVKLRMRADVPYGFALSGGLDSTMVLYSAFHQKGGQLASFSAIFPGMPGDETDHIRRVTGSLPLRSYFAKPFNNFSLDAFIQHIYHQDYPVQSTSYYAEYELARTVKSSGYTILLVGQGADELFGGYTAYFYEYGIQLLGKAKLMKLFSEVLSFSELKGIPSRQVFNSIYSQFKQVMKYKIKGNTAYTDRQKKLASCKSLREILKLDLTEYTLPLYLHSDDVDGMAFSIESRHPFLDYNLVDFAYSLPDKFKIDKGWQKILLRNSARELPPEIRWRKDKMGYTTPHNSWVSKYKKEFEEFAAQANEFHSGKKGDLFRRAALGIWLYNIKTKQYL